MTSEERDEALALMAGALAGIGNELGSIRVLLEDRLEVSKSVANFTEMKEITSLCTQFDGQIGKMREQGGDEDRIKMFEGIVRVLREYRAIKLEAFVAHVGEVIGLEDNET